MFPVLISVFLSRWFMWFRDSCDWAFVAAVSHSHRNVSLQSQVVGGLWERSEAASALLSSAQLLFTHFLAASWVVSPIKKCI